MSTPAAAGALPRPPTPGPDPAPPAAEPGSAELLACLARRHSVGPRHLTAPAPTTDELLLATTLALRAPDHRELRPWRLLRVPDAERERLAGLFAADAARRGHGAAEVERARERAFNGPALLAVVARIHDAGDEVPGHEQWICVGAAVMNLLNGLHLMGYGAKLLSGASVLDAAIQAAFCAPGERLVAWVVAGTPTRAPRARRLDDPQAALSDWTPHAPGTAAS